MPPAFLRLDLDALATAFFFTGFRLRFPEALPDRAFFAVRIVAKIIPANLHGAPKLTSYYTAVSTSFSEINSVI